MHIFLTGEIQVGKSTVIARTLSLLNITPGGYKTYFGPDRGAKSRLLYINAADKPPAYHEGNAIARMVRGEKPVILLEKFDVYGAGLLQSSMANARLILMDECGNLEQSAHIFQREIFRCLDGDIPVFGVVKQDSYGWTDGIRNHPKVCLYTVTTENRDSLPSLLTEQFANYI